MIFSMSCRHQFKCYHVAASMWHPLPPETKTVVVPVVTAQVRPDSEQSNKVSLRRLRGALLTAEMELELELEQSGMAESSVDRYRRGRNGNLHLAESHCVTVA